MYKAPVPIRALVPVPQDVPPGLEAIILKCLSKRPEHRYQSMQDLIVEFDKLAAGDVPDAVPEMMSRSGGFNVPVDYFKKGQMPAPVPATPSVPPGAGGNRFALYAGLAGVVAAIAIVVGIFANSHTSAAVPAPPSATAEAPVAESTATVAARTPPTVASPSTQVALAAVPFDSHVFRGTEDLGQSPVMIAVESGKAVELEIRHAGYKPEKITLDGKKTREVVQLEKAGRPGVVTARPAAPAARPKAESGTPAKKPKSGIGGSEIVNPWGN